MKKMMMSLFALFGFFSGASAQLVAVTDVEALPGETVALTMQLDTDGGSYTAFEFDILFPDAGFSTTGSATTAAGWDGIITVGDVGGVGISNLARCGALSLTDTPIPGTGMRNFGTVQFTVGSGVALGTYTVTLTNMTLIGDGRVPVPDATFTLSVVDKHTIVLDENSTTMPTEASGVDVRVIRTINAGDWSTICLPFAMTEEQTKEAFGSDVQLADFTSYDAEEDDDENIVTIKVNFATVTAIEANHPYIIKVSSPITEFTVDGVDVNPEEDPCVEYDNGLTGKKRKVLGTFIGTYVADYDLYNNAENYPLFLSGGKFYYATENTQHMKGFRAYFDFVDNLTEIEDAAVRMFIDIDGVETGIERVNVNGNNNDTFFDLSGRKVAAPQMHGVYIINGRKVLK